MFPSPANVAQAELAYDDVYSGKVDTYLAASKATRSKTSHDYSLEDYGLSKLQVAEAFKDYIARFELSEVRAHAK